MPPISEDSLSTAGALASTVSVSVTGPGFNVTLSGVVELMVISTPVSVDVAKPAAVTVTLYRPMASSGKLYAPEEEVTDSYFVPVSTLVATLLVGWVLLISGCVTLAGSFSIHGTGPFFGALLLGLLSTAAGVFLVFHPLAGAVALTLMVGVIFMVQGAFEVFFAFELRPFSSWVGMLVSGIASILIALLIAAGWPAISVVVLGILLGVNFITTGVGYMSVSRAMKPVL